MTSEGDTRTVTAAVRDGAGAITSSPTLAWTTSNPAVATVAGTGATATVTAVGDGTAIIGASAGSLQSSVTVTVHRRLASVQVSAPAPLLTLGQSMQMVAIALDARGHELTTITSFSWASSSVAVPLFNTTGLITALFTLNGAQAAVITATATLDGVTASGFTTVTEAVPQGFDFAALMLSEYELPTKVPTLGEGIAYFFADGAGLAYRIMWNRLSGPAVQAHIHGPGTAADVADILVDLAPSPETQNYGVLFGSITASDIHARPGQPAITVDSLRSLMRSRNVYVDVHTAGFAGGEIRGQVIDPFQ